MSKVYLPKSMVEKNIAPVFHQNDIIYFKYVDDDGGIVRIARADPVRGVIAALYPSGDPNHFFGEATYRIEDESARVPVPRSDIGDEIWLALLDNTPVPNILAGYECDMLGMYPSGSYKDKSGDRTFHILEKKESEIAESLSRK